MAESAVALVVSFRWYTPPGSAFRPCSAQSWHPLVRSPGPPADATVRIFKTLGTGRRSPDGLPCLSATGTCRCRSSSLLRWPDSPPRISPKYEPLRRHSEYKSGWAFLTRMLRLSGATTFSARRTASLDRDRAGGSFSFVRNERNDTAVRPGRLVLRAFSSLFPHRLGRCRQRLLGSGPSSDHHHHHHPHRREVRPLWWRPFPAPRPFASNLAWTRMVRVGARSSALHRSALSASSG
jgi:hypothetical protein